MASMKHTVVYVDNWVTPAPLDFDCERIFYESSTAEQLNERLQPATIVVISGTRLPRAAIDNAPNLQLVACNGTGTDHIDTDALRERGIGLCHVPAQNTDSVSEHAFALYYALRRKIIPMHAWTLSGDRWASGTSLLSHYAPPPRTNSEETLVVVGYGALGQKVEQIGKALGMRVLIADRKGAATVRDTRTAFDEALRVGTLFILVTPLDASTRDMFAAAEFAAMDPTALLVNVGRGGVMHEADLAQALRDKRIGGAATDVFAHEPAVRGECPLLDPSIPNLVLSPHMAWFSSKTIQGTLAVGKANLEAFAAGKPQNMVLPWKGA